MNSNEITVLDDYAKQIKSIYNGLVDCLKDFKSRSMEYAYKIGEILAKVKVSVPYNKFNAWIVNSCDFSISTAKVYFNVYKHYESVKECNDIQQARKMITAINKDLREKRYIEFKEIDQGIANGQSIKKRDNEQYYNYKKKHKNIGDLIKTPDKIVKPRLEGFKSYLDNWYICTSCGGKKIAKGFKRCPYCYKVLKWDDDKKINLDDYSEDPAM